MQEHRLQDSETTLAGCKEAANENATSIGNRRLRVLIITEEDPIYVIQFFRVFFERLPRHEIEICGITIDEPFHESITHTLRRMHGFYGAWGVIRLGSRFMSARLRGDTVTALAARLGVPIIKTESVNSQAYIAQIRQLSPDLIVSVAAPEVFRKDLLSVPTLGSINIHSGRLPHYRGMMPTFWQMLKGERSVTITVHEMVEKLDAGDILATRAFAIEKSDTLDRVISGSKKEGARLLLDVLERIRRGDREAVPLDWEQARYYSFPTARDVASFRQLGHRLL